MRKVAKNLAKSLSPARGSTVDKPRAKRRSMPEASDIHMLNFSTRKVPLVFKQNKRAQRIILRLDHGNSSIIVVLPKRTSRDEGKRFALSNKDWIAQHLDQLHEPVPFLHNNIIPILGTPHRISHKPNARGVVWCESEEIHVAGHEEHVSRRVQDWLKVEAKREIEARAYAKAEAIGKKIKKITIRDTKSRWGSCTSEGELAFSWRLIFAPKHVMDYVIAHEVAHLREMNHGPKFWKLCGEICRQMDSARLWLENHGTDLYRYGRF
jgi:predicted metal-dependent hydrolase